jgi:hypothetical protein
MSLLERKCYLVRSSNLGYLNPGYYITFFLPERFCYYVVQNLIEFTTVVASWFNSFTVFQFLHVMFNRLAHKLKLFKKLE